jgi:hypothetical protein
MMTTDHFTMYDAPYVLGALSPSDRREFEDHLKACDECTRSVGELAGLPGLMSKVSVEQLTAEPERVPETLLPSLARAVRRQRMRRRLAFGAAAAAAVLVAVGGVAITQPDPPSRPPVASSPSPSPGSSSSSANLALKPVVPSPVTASARLVSLAWGTRIDLTCTYDAAKRPAPADGVPYALVVVDRNGAAEQVATWKALPDRRLTVIGTSSRAGADIAAVEVRTLKGLTILRLTT